MTQVAFFHVGENDIFPAILVRSIRAHNPHARILQCSDLKTPQVEGTDMVQRFEGDIANVMGFRTACFSRLQIGAPTIFLDTDMVCLQSLDLPEILGDNDIAVCRRQFETKEIIEINFMSMNLAEYSGKALGQIWPYIGCATITKSADFWTDCLQILLQLPPKFHFWYGDQEAIRNVVGSNKYKTALLPESIYACPPETQPLYGNAVKLLHFKGADRKQMMIDYAKKSGLSGGDSPAKPKDNVSDDKKWSNMHGHLPIQEYVPPPADTSAMTLTELADYYKTDKGNIKHRYTEIYERYLRDLRSQPIGLLEIGVANGCSLKMWSDYFPSAKIHGIDIRTECKTLCAGYDRISIIVGDARKIVLPEFFDVIVDDGSHISQDIAETFLLQWPRLKKGGFYFIEDLRPTYDPAIWPFFPHYDQGRFNRGHFMGLVNFLMQSADLRQGSEIDYLHYYRELFIIKKAS